MANRKEVRDALVDDLRALAEDIRRALEDPKKRKRKERAWAMLEGALVVGLTFAARRLAMKAWSLLTGEQPPVRRGPPPKQPEAAPKAAAPAPSPEPSTPSAEAPTVIVEPSAPSDEAPTPSA
jgi:hypothetical protein